MFAVISCRIYLPGKCTLCFSENGNNVSREETGKIWNGISERECDLIKHISFSVP
jgi:hypothetical protein